MKFEQLLQIYWSRGFLYGGKVRNFNCDIKEFFEENSGLSVKSKIQFIKRFELDYFFYEEKNFMELPLDRRKIINMYLSEITSINSSIFDLLRFNFIRSYLIKTYKGRCYALGKPARGQRTWSNAANAYICNRVIRLFIQRVKKNNAAIFKARTPATSKSLNTKILKKKTKKIAPKIKMIFTKKKKNLWF